MTSVLTILLASETYFLVYRYRGGGALSTSLAASVADPIIYFLSLDEICSQSANRGWLTVGMSILTYGLRYLYSSRRITVFVGYSMPIVRGLKFIIPKCWGCMWRGGGRRGFNSCLTFELIFLDVEEWLSERNLMVYGERMLLSRVEN